MTNSLVFWIIFNNTNSMYLDEKITDKFIHFEFIRWKTDFESKNPDNIETYDVYKAKKCKLKDFCFG